MIRNTNWFSFRPPPDWGESNEGGRLIYQSPQGEVLMISSAAISGESNQEESKISELKERLFQNAISSLTNSVKHPDLKITKSLERDTRVRDVDCWTVEAETLDGQEIYFQAACRNGLGVMLISFEGYNSSTTKSQYDAFVRSISTPA